MQVNIKQIFGNWTEGYVLDKHSLGSVCVGHNASGYPVFDTTRTPVGEATFQLKNRDAFNQASILAHVLAEEIYPKFRNVGFIVPMPASTWRPRQPVTEIARSLGQITGLTVMENLLLKAKTGQSLKNLKSKAEKLEALGDSMSIHDEIDGKGRWNCLLIDDLFHTGASMEKACTVLKTYSKVGNIYVAALTWRPA